MTFKEFSEIWDKIEANAKKERYFTPVGSEEGKITIETSKEVIDYLDELVLKFQEEEKEKEDQEEARWHNVSKDVNPYSFGGEIDTEDFQMDEYGIDFGDFVANRMTAWQMASLATCMVNHLMLCGHRFSLREANSQDLPVALIYDGPAL